ncbi:uracil-DNA glycosylase [Candidatus Woesearchaeota archaeon]|nr:MAG: uracil-DNA glycosylase [Candidatus Woesearchaeota archaeon]
MNKLEKIEQEVKLCKKCRLYKSANKAVAGEGPASAKIMLIGQAPGKEEDRTGRPFVGRAGNYLDQKLKEAGVDRKKIFITSVVKHYPPGNRKPRADEIKACKGYLLRQIEAINPKIIVLMGNVASESLKEEEAILGKKIIRTCHPAAAMRFPEMGEKFTRAMKTLRRAAKEL